MTTVRSRTKMILGAGITGAAVICASLLIGPAAGATTNDGTTPPDQDERALSRIIGGQAVPNDAYPFMASLQASGESFCGARSWARRW